MTTTGELVCPFVPHHKVPFESFVLACREEHLTKFNKRIKEGFCIIRWFCKTWLTGWSTRFSAIFVRVQSKDYIWALKKRTLRSLREEKDEQGNNPILVAFLSNLQSFLKTFWLRFKCAECEPFKKTSDWADFKRVEDCSVWKMPRAIRPISFAEDFEYWFWSTQVPRCLLFFIIIFMGQI